jgi:NADP-dependent 3-hydroxy acid dehydrogenase YdfG
MNELKDKTIVITGTSSGAGRAAALKFAQQHCRLVLAARNETALNELKAECESLGATIQVVATDTGDSRTMVNLANAADHIDLWIKNAGILAAGDFDETPMAVHEQVIKANVLGYMNGAHAVLPILMYGLSIICPKNGTKGGPSWAGPSLIGYPRPRFSHS